MAYRFFRHPPLYPIGNTFGLHKVERSVERSVVDDDIRLNLRTRLREGIKAGGRCDHPKGWPSSNDIDILCHEARGSFIHTSKFIKLLASQHDLTIETFVWCMAQINDAPEHRWMAPPVEI